ncbi:hypothetical protein [Allomesorhizobium alhagi]|jgi:hypothetical protein|uniref:Uncharacterized protein n=1 Tax=Mesorhizobium alhagi CCNWXJ12-2 TaxID=1107882 RepID=H0I0B3_9HYPH|nr:hypothetical protein [Mesorhizobium alhagi]EHK53573.1 hypothetical protein MAXJ12_29500 [Mesorhizobium alhagi CCNWXJ12-2]
MSKVSSDSDIQLATAREVMDGYDIALQALASERPDTSTEEGTKFQRQMEAARERMKKYTIAYRALAK